jgi:hypothetical protein
MNDLERAGMPDWAMSVQIFPPGLFPSVVSSGLQEPREGWEDLT